jgi:uncharacterized protein (TIGR03435 family)
VRASVPLQLPTSIEVRAAPGLLEPGVVGLLRPMLLMPDGILERLTPLQLEAVLAHELCHIRRRDNLSAALHMIVEALFWFHPLVWWISVRLVEERERACDEEVLRRGGEPQVYAEALLNVCKYYLESPLGCVSGISGADMKKRIHAIIAPHAAHKLSPARKLLLTAVAIAAVAVPIAIGLLNAPASRAQSTAGRPEFDVASIKPSNSADRRTLYRSTPGQFTANNFTVKMLIARAYDIKPFQIVGGPGWTGSDLFDIVGKSGPTNLEQTKLMLQSLLAERFQLVIRRDTKEMPVYTLVVSKGGPKFKDVKQSDPNIVDLGGRPDRPAGGPRPRVAVVRRGRLTAQGSDMPALAAQLSNFLGRAVLDKTGLTGTYDLKLEWQPDENQVAMFEAMRVPEGYGAPAPDPMGPTLFTALQEQLGLKLESGKGPVEMFAIERVEKPSPN